MSRRRSNDGGASATPLSSDEPNARSPKFGLPLDQHGGVAKETVDDAAAFQEQRAAVAHFVDVAEVFDGHRAVVGDAAAVALGVIAVDGAADEGERARVVDASALVVPGIGC